MDNALKTLSSSGTTGALMAALLFLLGVAISALVLMVTKLFNRNMLADAEREKKYNEFMSAFTASLNAMTLNLQATRQDSLAAIRDTQASLLSGIRDVVWVTHEKAKVDRKELIELAVEKISGEITGAANSIRASNKEMMAECEKARLNDEKQRLREERDELSRPHNVDPAAPRPGR